MSDKRVSALTDFQSIPSDGFVLIDSVTDGAGKYDANGLLKVKQSALSSSSDHDYPILTSYSYNTDTESAEVKKSDTISYNPDASDLINSDTWDGTHDSLKDAIANSGGGGGAGVTLLTRAQYDALSTAQKNNGNIYFVYATANPDYEYKVLKSGQIIAQKNRTTSAVTWWFIGFSNEGNDWQLPSDMQNWLPSDLIYGQSYDSDKTTPNANIGVYQGYIREWSLDLGSLVGYPTWGVITNSGGYPQSNVWSDPPVTDTENAIFYMSKQFASYDVS